MSQGRQAARRLRVAVVGAGIGKQHIEAYQQLSDLYEVVAFCDAVPERAAAVVESYRIGALAADLDELLAMEQLDIIDLCTPPRWHVPQIKMALRAGKHVVCEKPLGGSLAEMDELAALEQVSSGRVCPIFQYRFGNGFQKLQHLQAKGALGRAFLATVETHWRRDADYFTVPWRGRFKTELGGCLVSHAIHAHDLLTEALGPAVNVHARTATRVNPIEVEDCAVLSLEMADGSLAALSVTLGAASEHTRLWLYFENAAVTSSLGPYDPQIEPWIFEPRGDEAAGVIEAAIEDFEPGLSGFAGQFAALHPALTEGAALPVSLASSRRSIELFTAAYYAASSGEAVSLPLGVDHPAYHGWPRGEDVDPG